MEDAAMSLTQLLGGSGNEVAQAHATLSQAGMLDMPLAPQQVGGVQPQTWQAGVAPMALPASSGPLAAGTTTTGGSTGTAAPGLVAGALEDLFGYDPTLPALSGDPALNPDTVHWQHTAQRNQWADWGNTSTRTFNMATHSIQEPPAQLMEDMVQAAKLAAMVGAQQAVAKALQSGGASQDDRLVSAVAAAAASRMAPRMLRIVQSHRKNPVPIAAEVSKLVSQVASGGIGAGPATATGAAAATRVGAATGVQRGVSSATGAQSTQQAASQKPPAVDAAEEKRRKRLARNRAAAAKSRKRHKHRVQCMERELTRLVDKSTALEFHKWGVDVSSKPGDVSSRAPPAEPSHLALRRGLGRLPRRYSPETDNYADFVVIRARYRSSLKRDKDAKEAATLEALKRLRVSALSMQASVFDQMYLLWAAEKVLCGTPCASDKCPCDLRTYAEFQSRKNATSAEIVTLLGQLGKDSAERMVQSREGVKRSMLWLQQLAGVLNRFENLLKRGLTVSHRLSAVLAEILTPQQVEKLGAWYTSHAHIVDAWVAENRSQLAKRSAAGAASPAVQSSPSSSSIGVAAGVVQAATATAAAARPPNPRDPKRQRVLRP